MDPATCAEQAALLTQQHEIIALLITAIGTLGAGLMVYAHRQNSNGKGTNHGQSDHQD